MKRALKILSFLINGGFIFLIAGCQPDFKYESFTDLEQKGLENFNTDLKTCRGYGQLHSKKSEGSQGAGERSLLNNNLVLTCMKNKQWILKNS